MEPTTTFLICQASMLALEAHGVAVVMVKAKVVNLYVLHCEQATVCPRSGVPTWSVFDMV